MGYADGYYYGQGRIICDTSTFSVGDTIRVRSMTDSSKVWNQQVATVGTALVFTVPCYDYYKICTVQDIGGTPTEIGGIYKTVDYGQTLFINILDKSTLGGLQGILNAHTETNFINIGDEVNVRMLDSNLQPFNWVMQVGAINLFAPHEVILVSKNIYSKQIFHSAQTAYVYTSLRTYVQSIYDSISDLDKPYIKEMTRQCFYYNNAFYNYSDKIWIPSYYEIFGQNPIAGGGTPTILNKQIPIFATQNNRIKTYEGLAIPWWTSDYRNANNAVDVIDTSGNVAFKTWSEGQYGVLPCIEMKADS